VRPAVPVPRRRPGPAHDEVKAGPGRGPVRQNNKNKM